jgi:hypothetical protein
MLAQIVKGRLEANGIPCYLADENINTIMPIYNQMTGGVKLRVFAHDIERAKLLIAEDSSLEIEDVPTAEKTTTCPYCGSTNVNYGPAIERKHSWWGIIVSFVASIFFVMGIYPFFAHKAVHCFNCGRDFKKPFS